MKQLIFSFNMFDIEQKALMIDTDSGSTIASYAIDKIDDAGAVIAKTCIETEVLNVHLFGEEMYLNDFVIPNIERYFKLSHYNFENLNIEVT